MNPMLSMPPTFQPASLEAQAKAYALGLAGEFMEPRDAMSCALLAAYEAGARKRKEVKRG